MENSTNSITVEEARADRDRFIANSNLDYSAFTFEFSEFKKFMDFIEFQKTKGVDVKYLTVYLSKYKNGKTSAFIAPLKKDGTPNYNVKALNHGSVIPPLTGNHRGTTAIKY